MDSSAYDAKIELAIHEKVALHNQLQANAASYIHETTLFFRNYIREIVEREITSQPEAVQRMGIEKIRELKSSLNNLIERVPNIVNAILKQPTIWDHLREIPRDLEDAGQLSSAGVKIRVNAGEQIVEQLRPILGPPLQLLLKFGIVPSQFPRYKDGVTISKAMDALKKRHVELFEDYLKAHVDVIVAEREKQQAIAQDLWNKA